MAFKVTRALAESRVTLGYLANSLRHCMRFQAAPFFGQFPAPFRVVGAIKPEALPNIKKMGFVSVINLREPAEPGANIVEEGEAAKAAGLRYYSIPFNANSPDPAAADKFLDAIR